MKPCLGHSYLRIFKYQRHNKTCDAIILSLSDLACQYAKLKTKEAEREAVIFFETKELYSERIHYFFNFSSFYLFIRVFLVT